MIEAFPLHWPVGYERTKQRKYSRFKGLTTARARDELKEEIRRIGGTQPIISTDIPLKRDGDMYGSYKEPSDPGVAVYFMYKGSQVCLCADIYAYVCDNLKAVARTIAALRQIDRDGVSDFLNRTFNGFKELPAGGTVTAVYCWQVLGIDPTTDIKKCRDAYVKLLPTRHPDGGGTHEAFLELQKAYEEAKEQCG